MPKSTQFQQMEYFINNIINAKSECNPKGNKEFQARILNGKIDEFIRAVTKNILQEKNEQGNLLMHVINSFSKHPDILQFILQSMVTKIAEFNIGPSVYTAELRQGKSQITNPLKLAASVSLETLNMILLQICEIEEKHWLHILTGMTDLNLTGKKLVGYPRTNEHLFEAFLSLPLRQRVKLLATRDNTDDNANVIAYAAQAEDSVLLELILRHKNEVFAADEKFISEPTQCPVRNAQIYLYILSQPNLLIQLNEFEDLDTLEAMLTTRGVGGLNAVATALKLGPSKHLSQLLVLVERLEIDTQRKIMDQLDGDAKRKLSKCDCCPEDIKAMLIELVGGRSSTQQHFKVADVTDVTDEADRAAVVVENPSVAVLS